MSSATVDEKQAYRKAWLKAYREANKEKIRDKNRVHLKTYYEANKDKLRARQRTRSMDLWNGCKRAKNLMRMMALSEFCLYSKT